jgi:DNA polymerase III alpha subunit
VKNVKREIPNKKKYHKRIIKEFKLIQKNEFEKVFLHVIEILKMMAGMPHVIRGSAGSSLLCYLLGITNFDPIKENIVLSRFMHKHRHDMPDYVEDYKLCNI